MKLVLLRIILKMYKCEFGLIPTAMLQLFSQINVIHIIIIINNNNLKSNIQCTSRYEFSGLYNKIHLQQSTVITS